MATTKPQLKKKKPKEITKKRQDFEQIERLDSLPWTSSLPDNAADPFSIPVGSNELEGGFLSLEEIDETDYGLEIPKHDPKNQTETQSQIKLGKRKQTEGKENGDTDDEDGNEREQVEVKEKKKAKAKKRKTKREKKKAKKSKEITEVSVVIEGKDDVKEYPVDVKEDPVDVKEDQVDVKEDPLDAKEDPVDVKEDLVDEAEYHEWSALRLHPLLMKSIYRLKFKEPTPIQKACIPAAAHQGKDVIGAAETGSGKTLAFGLPILQRLLEEREKYERLVESVGDANGKITSIGFLRALIITPTRELALQITDHLKEVSKGTDIKVVPIVGGLFAEKQERKLKQRPEIVVGTPGRLWQLMSGGEIHLLELHSLSFFVLDEADRMIDGGHFHELQSIIEMLPMNNESNDSQLENTQNCVTVSSSQRKKRQTLVFSATISLSSDFRKKLKRGSLKSKTGDGLNSIEALSKRAGMKANAAVIDLTNASIMANKLEESFIECREEDKDAYLYYILSVHGQGRTIVFCTSIAALRHISSLLRILEVNVFTLHAQMQQRARLKAMDRFRENEHGILVATDVAARGLDIPGVRTVVHYQLPHSAEVYVHRSGRTARASADGCSIALISPVDTSKFSSLCKSFDKASLKKFPIESSYMPEVLKRLSLARQIDKVARKDSKEKVSENWFKRNADSIGLVVEDDDSEEERVSLIRQKKASSANLKKLQQELKLLLSRPLQPKSFSRRYFAGAGVSPLLQQQVEELARLKHVDLGNSAENKRKLIVIGQDCMEPLQALRNAGQEVSMDLRDAEKRKNMDSMKRKRKEEKKRLHEQRRKQRKRMKQGGQ